MRENKGKMTVAEAGRKGGQRTSETHGPGFYSEIGQKGGQKVKRLIQEGRRAEGEK
ncbi:MAG: Em GEA1 (EM1) [bacterium]|nr:Em GEA1 (EM1) [bacterium]